MHRFQTFFFLAKINFLFISLSSSFRKHLSKPAPCSSERDWSRHPRAPSFQLCCTTLWCLSHLRRKDMLWGSLLYCTLLLICLPGPPPPVNENEGLSCPSRTWQHADLQRTLLPRSPLSMIHCFLGPFPLHPIDGFQSYLNFHVPTCSGVAGALSLALLWIVQGHRRGEEGGRQSIYQDVLLYFFYPSPRRWFYFSENPLNSDQVRWLLSLETQELPGHNQYKCRTLKWGAPGQWWSSGDLSWSFLLLRFYPITFLSHFFSTVPFTSEKVQLY